MQLNCVICSASRNANNISAAWSCVGLSHVCVYHLFHACVVDSAYSCFQTCIFVTFKVFFACHLLDTTAHPFIVCIFELSSIPFNQITLRLHAYDGGLEMEYMGRNTAHLLIRIRGSCARPRACMFHCPNGPIGVFIQIWGSTQTIHTNIHRHHPKVIQAKPQMQRITQHLSGLRYSIHRNSIAVCLPVWSATSASRIKSNYPIVYFWSSLSLFAQHVSLLA